MAKRKTKKKAQSAQTAPLLKAKEVAAHFGVTDRTVRAWIKRGCPCRRIKPRGKKGGLPRLWFNLAKISEWTEANGIPATRDRVDSSPEGPVPVPPPDVSDIDKDTIKKAGIKGAVERLRSMERIAYAAFVQAVSHEESSDKVRSKQRIYVEVHQALRRSEKDTPSILEHRGETISLDVVLREQAKIDLAIKNQFLTLPRKLAPGLSTISDPGEIEEMLQNEIDDCLRHITSGAVLQDEKTPDVQAPGAPASS